MEPAERAIAAAAGWRLQLIPESHRRLTGRPLLGGGEVSPEQMWAAQRVVLAHGVGEDPLFVYGNRAGLELFEMTPERFLATPSRHSAEPVDRAERARLLEAVTRQGFIDDYAGVRISANGRRFRIEQATVWNLVDAKGAVHGQAATFERWTRLD